MPVLYIISTYELLQPPGLSYIETYRKNRYPKIKVPSRTVPLITNQVYHIYNRGTEKRLIFESRRDQTRFIKGLGYYQYQGPKPSFSQFNRFPHLNIKSFDKIVEILAYCLMPNHFHLLIKQLDDEGITEFVSKLANSYTKYYNTKYNRIGPLFQGEFKAVLVNKDEQLTHVSRYIHLNPLTSYLVEDLGDYEWSSYHQYMNGSSGLCTTNEILSYFKSVKDYKQFIMDQASYAQEIWSIKHLVIDTEN